MDNQQITNFKELAQKVAISPEDNFRIQHGTFEDIHHALYTIQASHPDLQLNIDSLTQQAVAQFRKIPIDTEEGYTTRNKEKNAASLGDSSGFAALALAFEKNSKEHDLANAFEIEKKNETNQKIDTIIQATSPTEREEKVRELLTSLQRDRLYDERKSRLVEQLKEASPKKAEKTITKIEERHTELQKGRHPTDGTKATTASDSAYQAYLERLIKRLPTMSDDELKSFLKKYVDRQMQGTRNDFVKLFSEDRELRTRFKFLGKYKRQKRIVSVKDQNKIYKKQQKITRPILEKWKREGKQLKKLAKEKKEKEQQVRQQKLNAFRRFLNLRRVVLGRSGPQRTSYSAEYYSGQDDDTETGNSGGGIINSVYNGVQKIQNLKSWANRLQDLGKLFGKGGAPSVAGEVGATGAGGGAISGLLANPYFWAGLAILILLVIIIVVIQQNPQFGHPNLPVAQVGCGDEDKFLTIYQDETDIFVENGGSKGSGIDRLLSSYFHMNFLAAEADGNLITSGDPHFQTALTNVKSMVSTLCILFGHVAGQSYDSTTYINSFGGFVVGSSSERDSHKAAAVQLGISYSSNDPSCSYAITKNGNPQQEISVVYTNPDKCTNVYQFQYIIAQSLTHVMLMQQDILHGKGQWGVYSDFLTHPTGGIIQQDSPLPSQDCQDSTDREGKTADPQQRACFADMVGAYLTYPFYFDGTNTLTPTANPTKSQSAQFTSPLSDFPTGKYIDYYNFAYTNLFNNESFFTQSGSSSGVVSCNDPLTASLPDDTKAIILKKYGFRVAVDKGLNEEDQLAQTYNTLCLLFQSSTFVKLLGTINPDGSVADAMTLIIHKSPDYQNRCGIGKDFDSNQPEIYACVHPDANRFVLVHELGHTVYARNIQLSVQYDNLFTGAQKFPDGKNNSGQRFLPTDNCQLAGTAGFGSHVSHECFADMVAEYVVFSTYKHSITNRNPAVNFSEFATDPQYKDWYDWVGKNVFGGTSYDNQSSSTLVTYAKTLKDQIVQACPPQHNDHGWEVGGYVFVNQKNKDCLTNMPAQALGSHKQSVLTELYNSISNFYYLQCVGFARAVAQGVGAPIGDSDRASSQYYTWIPVTLGLHNVPGGVMAGDIALFSLHECAYSNIPFNRCPRLARYITPHIGIVIDVGPTGFDLAEANGGNGSVDITKGYNYHYDFNFDGVLRLKKSLP